MKNLFDAEVAHEIQQRLSTITANSQRQWGTMDVAQMLAHVSRVIETAVGDRKYKTSIIGKILAPFVKKMVFNEKPFSKNLPTGKAFKMVHDKEFEKEHTKLVELLNRFLQMGQLVENNPHPLFGKLTQLQWGQSQYKHLHHHFTQFGA
jgi:hypothetical protein